jgi:U3 small nucleolar RNA-associated protein 7
MDALLASAGPLSGKKRHVNPSSRPRTGNSAHKTIDRGPDKESIDPSTHSILNTTRLPSSFHTSTLPTGSSSAPIRPDASLTQIRDKKLRAKVTRENVAGKRARIERDEVDEWLNRPLGGGAGGIEVDEGRGERSWRVGQDDIVKQVGEGSGRKRFDLKFDDLGDYMVDYTRNGRYLAIASTRGHVATFDWQAGVLGAEIQLRETVRDIKWV